MEILKNTISFKELIAEKKSVFSEMVDTIIPDTYPDIFRIVAVDGAAFLKDESVQKDRVLLSGSVKVVLVYEAEEGNTLYKLPVSISFAHIEEIRGIDNDSIIDSCVSIISSDTKIINSRKVMINVSMLASTDVYNNKTIEVTEDIVEPDKALEILKGNSEVNLTLDTEKSIFTILEDIDIDDIKDIVGTLAVPKISDIKLMQGKVILRGDMDTKIRYITGDDKLMVLCKSLPFSQMIDLETLSDEADVSLCVRAIDTEIRSENTISLCVTVCAFIKQKKLTNISHIEDMYHTEYMLDCEMQNHKITGEDSGKTFTLEEMDVFSLGTNVTKIIDSSASLENVTLDKDLSSAKITANVTIIYTDDMEKIYSVSRKINIDIDNFEGDIRAITLDVNPKILGSDSIEVRLMLQVTTYNKKTINILDAKTISIKENMPKSRDKKLTLVLKNITDSENLWTIAKEYNAKMSDIVEANELENNTLAVSNRLLLIPIS